MPFTIRRLNLEEMDRAAVILRTSFDERIPWLAGLHTPAEDRAYLREQVFSECEVWGALDDEIVGFIAFRAEWIGQLYVLPDRQGRGAGDALLQVAKEKTSILQLWTFQKNIPARHFYEKRGFVLVKETDGSNNEEREPDALYRWSRTGG